MFKRIIFWEPCVSPHKSFLFEKIGKYIPGVEVVCVASSDIPVQRKKLGWDIPRPENYSLVVSNDPRDMAGMVSGRSDEFHVLSGIRHFGNINYARKQIKKNKALFGIMSEPRVFEGLKGYLRLAQSRVGEFWERNNVAVVFAIGRNGPEWFRLSGYKASKIYPFAYFIDHPGSSDYMRDADAQELKVGYVGRLTREKGVFLFAEVLQKNSKLRGVFVGDGPDRVALSAVCDATGVGADWLGVRPICEIPEIMAQLDVLVLASLTKDDGWGVVVSEALLQGTAVVATSCVGASILLDDHSFGECVPPHSANEILAAIERMRQSQQFSRASRIKRQARAMEMLTAEAGARYFAQVLEHRFGGGPRPVDFYQASGGM